MWDIKRKMERYMKGNDGRYYLNHVGYKAKVIHFTYINVKEYYLNHVGYKVKNSNSKSIKSMLVLSEPCGI